MLEKIRQINIGDLKTESDYKKTLSILLNVVEELCISLQQSEATKQELREEISRLKGGNEKPKFESKFDTERDEKDRSSKNQESGAGKTKSEGYSPSQGKTYSSLVKKERAEILQAGLQYSPYIQSDSTQSKESGKSQKTHIFGSDAFSVFYTRYSPIYHD